MDNNRPYQAPQLPNNQNNQHNYPYAPRITNTMATISLIFGILSWTLLPLIGCIVAIITGHIARQQIRDNPQQFEGDGLAVAGLIMGWGQIILSILGIAIIFLFFGGMVFLAAVFGNY